MVRGRFARSLAALLFLASVGTILWVHRIHIDRPNQRPFFLNSDMVGYFYPVTVFMHREVREGRWPLWDPYQLAGVPFVALQASGALYPPNRLLARWFEPARALEVDAVFHMIVAGFFTWLFAGRLGLGTPARLAAALAYMLAPSMLHGFYMIAFLSTQAWLPAVLWSAHGALVEARPRWAVALAGALSLGFLGGHAQGLLYQAELVSLYALFGLAFVTPPDRRARAFWTLALAGGMSLGLMAIQMLPALELARQGTRTLYGLSLKESSLGALTPKTLKADTIGVLLDALRGKYAKESPIGYLSALTLPLILIGLASKRYLRHWLFFFLICLLAGMFMLGERTFVFRMYYSLPFGSLFRNPTRIAFIYEFSAAMLVGLGVQGAVGLAALGRPRGHAPGFVGALLVVGLLAGLYHGSKLRFFHPSLRPSEGFASRRLVEGLKLRIPLGRAFLEARQLPRWDRLHFKMGIMNGLFIVPDYEPMLPEAYARYFNVPEKPPWHGRMSILGGFRTMPREELARLLDLMSVEYYLMLRGAPRRIREALDRFTKGESFVEGEALLSRRASALPRAYIVDRLLHEPDPDKALRLLRSPSFNPRETAVVEDGLPKVGAGVTRAEGRAVITSYQPERVIMKAACRADCFLVLTDLFYPGWTAQVDGRNVKIHRANFLFRGVELDPGLHEVVFGYRPRSFHYGSLITLLTLALAVGLAVGDLLWRRPKRRPAPTEVVN